MGIIINGRKGTGTDSMGARIAGRELLHTPQSSCLQDTAWWVSEVTLRPPKRPAALWVGLQRLLEVGNLRH